MTWSFYFLNFCLWKQFIPDNKSDGGLPQSLDVNFSLGMFSKAVCNVLGDWISVSLVDDRNIFENIYLKNVSAWDWKARTQEEKEKIFSNFYVFKNWKNILWWVCLTLKNNEIFLECLYVSETWKWYWSLILKYVTSLWYNVVTFSKKWWFFEKFGFEKVEGEFSVTGAPKYVFEIKSLNKN